MVESVFRTKYPKLFKTVLCAIVEDQPFRNSMLVEDSLEMIDDSARADVCQFSYSSETCCISRQLADIPCHSNGIDR